MSELLDDNNSALNSDPDLQVKKLQQLVKKLEKQNQQLRNKQNNTLTLVSQNNDNDDGYSNTCSATESDSDITDLVGYSAVSLTHGGAIKKIPKRTVHLQKDDDDSLDEIDDDLLVLDITDDFNLEEDETW